ncbi:MAG: insulinase family protein [Acidobacteria bacterium]|nr:insulinase family protein [Acidobacteriota bacterium]
MRRRIAVRCRSLAGAFCIGAAAVAAGALALPAPADAAHPSGEAGPTAPGAALAPGAPLVLGAAAAASATASAPLGSRGAGQEGSSSILSLPAPGSPLVTLRIAFRTGAADDPVGRNGLNALTALTMGRGGTGAMTFEAITEALYPWSASIRAQFDKEMTVLVGEVHRDHLDPFFAILRDLVTAPRFDGADFARNRDFLVNSLVSSLRGGNDEELGKEALNALIYAGHPYEAPAMGTEEGLAAITLDDVRAFHRTHYTRERALVGIAGGYPDGFAERVERELLGGLPAGGAEPRLLPTPRPLDGIEVLLVDKDAIATAISIGFPIEVTRADDDFFALLVANSYFGEHRTFNGLLMNKMRGQRGLNYGDYSYIESFIQDGGSRLPVPNIPRRQQFFSIWIRPVPHHNAHFALRQAIRELHVLVDEGLTPEAFEATREFLLNYSKLYVQTTSRRLGYHLDSAVYGGGYFIDEIQRRLGALTVDDVNAAIRRHLQYDDLAVGIVTRDAAAFRDRLLANEPSPPTYNTEVPEAIRAEDALIEAFELAINPDRVRVAPVGEMFRAVSGG